MRINDAMFELSAFRPEQYPNKPQPDVALVGRSNVGKSSLINTLLSKKNLARVAAKPGKTGEINFYNVNGQFYIVDLPGYGYAKVSKETKTLWNQMIETYLNTRNQLKLVLMLVDIRHIPNNDDKLMVDWLNQMKIPYIIVATKADKISRSQIPHQLDQIGTSLGLPQEIGIVAFSAESPLGHDLLWQAIRSFLTIS